MNMQQQLKQLTQAETTRRVIEYVPVVGLLALVALLPGLKRAAQPYVKQAGMRVQKWYQKARSQHAQARASGKGA